MKFHRMADEPSAPEAPFLAALALSQANTSFWCSPLTWDCGSENVN